MDRGGQGLAADQLETCHSIAAGAARAGQHFQRGIEIAQCDERGLHVFGIGEKLADRRRDDAERPFATDIELLKVISRIVLAQPLQAVPDTTVRQDDFQPEDQFPRVAIAQNVHAARIGRQIAADLATALGTETERKQPVDRFRCFLDVCEDTAGFNRDRIVERIDISDIVHPAEADQDRRTVRDAGADQPRIAALRHDRDIRRRANLDHFGDRFGTIWPNEHGAVAMEQSTLVGEVRCDRVGIRAPTLIADDLLDPVERGRLPSVYIVERNGHGDIR